MAIYRHPYEEDMRSDFLFRTFGNPADAKKKPTLNGNVCGGYAKGVYTEMIKDTPSGIDEAVSDLTEALYYTYGEYYRLIDIKYIPYYSYTQAYVTFEITKDCR